VCVCVLGEGGEGVVCVVCVCGGVKGMGKEWREDGEGRLDVRTMRFIMKN
jgi:hypothetical protein